jgi:hypothetical protein
MVQAQFTPIISIYAAAEFQEGQFIPGEILSPVLLKHLDIMSLKEDQLYTLSQSLDGTYVLTLQSG